VRSATTGSGARRSRCLGEENDYISKSEVPIYTIIDGCAASTVGQDELKEWFDRHKVYLED
jgi:hypothetical protein